MEKLLKLSKFLKSEGLNQEHNHLLPLIKTSAKGKDILDLRFKEGMPEAPAHLEEVLRSFTSRNIPPELTEEEYDEIMSEKLQALREV